jgi:hypothetical protein
MMSTHIAHAERSSAHKNLFRINVIQSARRPDKTFWSRIDCPGRTGFVSQTLATQYIYPVLVCELGAHTFHLAVMPDASSSLMYNMNAFTGPADSVSGGQSGH